VKLFGDNKLRKRTYDAWIANIIRKGNIPLKIDDTLGVNEMSIKFNYIETGRGFIKYYLMTKWPDYVKPNMLSELRLATMANGVKMNYYIMSEPHIIQWDSTEMINRVNAWRKFTENADQKVNVFDYRENKAVIEQKMRLMNSTMYLNKAELDQSRTMCKSVVVIQVMCEHNRDAVVACNASCKQLLERAKIMGFKLKPIELNMVDWAKFLGPFSFRQTNETTGKIIKKVMTDDILADLSGYKQGRIGNKGIPMGTDVKRHETVLYQFKEDPNKPENWLISAMTGGGKSYFTKAVLIWLIAQGFTVTIMDYEGDEYAELQAEIEEETPELVKTISMGKGSAAYVDPMEIPDLTGDPDVDDDLKETATNFAMAMFRIIVHGVSGQLTRMEESVINMAIAHVFDEFGVTDDKSTWHRSKGIRIHDVYDDIKLMVERMTLLDDTTENQKHRAAVEIIEAGKPYFDTDGVKSGTFKQPITVKDVQSAKVIIFSFGAKGAAASTTDQTIMALKQLSVANISTQISNYSKYVNHCFNVKVWEEYQRYGEIEGSAEIIANSMTGGRKRGDINFIITNDLSNILDDTIKINKTLLQNITSFAIGKIKDSATIERLCQKLQLQELEPELKKISKASGSNKSSVYNKAFCLIFDDGKRAVVQAKLPRQLSKNRLFSTGVVTDKDKDKKKQ